MITPSPISAIPATTITVITPQSMSQTRYRMFYNDAGKPLSRNIWESLWCHKSRLRHIHTAVLC